MYGEMKSVSGKTADRETKLLQTALEVFYNTTGLQVVIETNEAAGKTGHRADVLVRLAVPGIDGQFVVEVKSQLNSVTLGMALHQLAHFPQKGMIVTDYINPKMAERLKAADIPFLDVAGNAYLNTPPIYVFIKGNKPSEKTQRKPPTRAFQPTGLKMLFALLCYPDLENASYRDIAKAADIALGSVGWVITDLKELGYLVDMGKRGRRLINKEKLVERWVTTFPEQLRPKFLLGRYRAVDPDWWKHAALNSLQAYWGGEVAASKLTKYLKPEQVTIYTKEKPGKLLLTNKLKKDPQGNVEVLEAFWQGEYNWSQTTLAPPLLIYADLIATGDARNIETAKMIYEQELVGLIRED